MMLFRIAVLVMVIVHLSACAEPSMMETASSSIAIDLSALTTTVHDGSQVECASAVEAAILIINGRERRRLQMDGAESNVRFENVRVVPGRVAFEVEIRSRTDVLLYSGDRTAEVEGIGYQVTIPLEPRNGVLVVCPAEQIVMRSGGWMDVRNYGIRTMAFEVVEPPASCGGRCFFMPQLQDSIRAGERIRFEFFAESMASGPYTVRVNSDVGPVDVIVHTN